MGRLESLIKIDSYSVIYGIDGNEKDIGYYEPEKKELWKQTEDGETDYDIPNWMHKKFVALLTPKQFDEFVDNQGLFAEDVETMGALGQVGYGFGWSPAISFRSENDCIQSAYVTPNVNKNEAEKFRKQTTINQHGETIKNDSDKLWEAVRKQVIRKYGI